MCFNFLVRCKKEKPKYTCPRCNIRYCSSACYKSEGHLQCSENFYKECFMEGLRDQQIRFEFKNTSGRRDTNTCSNIDFNLYDLLGLTKEFFSVLMLQCEIES